MQRQSNVLFANGTHLTIGADPLFRWPDFPHLKAKGTIASPKITKRSVYLEYKFCCCQIPHTRSPSSSAGTRWDLQGCLSQSVLIPIKNIIKYLSSANLVWIGGQQLSNSVHFMETERFLETQGNLWIMIYDQYPVFLSKAARHCHDLASCL